MSGVSRTAGIVGTFPYTLSVAPYGTPSLTIYSDSARTVVAVAAANLVATADPKVWTATYPAGLAAGTYYLKFTTTITNGQPAYVDTDDTLTLVTVTGAVDATLDLLTLAEAKRAINVAAADTTVDAELAVVITAVSQRLDDLCGPIVLRAVSEVHDGAGESAIFLRQAPASLTAATTITTVTEYAGTTATVLSAETHASQPAEAYMFETEVGLLHRHRSGFAAPFAWGQRNIEVTYQAGRYADTTSVAAKFKQAGAIALAHIWTNIGAGNGGGGFPGAEGAVAFGIPPWDVPKAALLLLASERRTPGQA